MDPKKFAGYGVRTKSPRAVPNVVRVQLVENEGDHYYARELARSDAEGYVKRLRRPAKK